MIKLLNTVTKMRPALAGQKQEGGAKRRASADASTVGERHCRQRVATKSDRLSPIMPSTTGSMPESTITGLDYNSSPISAIRLARFPNGAGFRKTDFYPP
ncbi:hypothetical protein [uncultured Aquitalea sp.]|uniref:hypothetical protein n=1 Tax=uncultured Aquitalea sp. TaxID=540272 RepID=UPI0025CFA087|nr:hypothetical protein [uncultured Aquitalea sp.]